MVRAAWKHEDSQHDNPQPYGNDGWTSIIQPATYAVIKKLKDEGYTYINLETGGVAQRRKDVHISALI